MEITARLEHEWTKCYDGCGASNIPTLYISGGGDSFEICKQCTEKLIKELQEKVGEM